MFIRALCLSALAVAFAAPTASSASYETGHSTMAAHQRHNGGLRLPKELKMIWRQEEHGHLKAMPKEQRHGWLKTQWASMSESQKHAKMAELQAKWDALPETVRQHLIDKKRLRHEAHGAQKAEGGGYNRSQSPSTMQQ